LLPFAPLLSLFSSGPLSLLTYQPQQFSLTSSSLSASACGNYKDVQPLANVTVLGVKDAVKSVTFNGNSLKSGWNYNGTSKVLDVKGLADSTAKGAWTGDWVLKWA
jgi:alpha-glucosidase